MFGTAIPPYACTIDFRKLKYSIHDLSTGEKFENGKDNKHQKVSICKEQ